MRYGLQFPPMGEFADPFLLAELARAAEAAGWDGFFSWDAVIPHWPADLLDPTVAVAVIAMQTTRLRCGILVTPLPRRRPWKFARETAALDRLSGGRLVVGVGTGGDPAEFDEVGDEPSARIRGQMLDEGLALLTGLWSGEPYRHEGDRHDGGHYRIGEVTFTPRPVQVPRPPIWVGGQWPNPKPARRAARWDGYHPLDRDNFAFARMMSVELMREAVAFVRAERAALDIAPDAPFDGGCDHRCALCGGRCHLVDGAAQPVGLRLVGGGRGLAGGGHARPRRGRPAGKGFVTCDEYQANRHRVDGAGRSRGSGHCDRAAPANACQHVGRNAGAWQVPSSLLAGHTARCHGYRYGGGGVRSSGYHFRGEPRQGFVRLG